MSTGRATSAEMVNAAYDLDQNLQTWFARAVSLFRAHLDEGFGAYGAIAARNPPRLAHVQLDGAHPATRALMRLGPSLGIYQRLPHGFSADTTSRLLGALNAKALAPFRRVLIGRDHCGLSGPDGAGLFMVMAAPRSHPGPARAFEHKLAQTVLPHFAAALRLRRALTGLSLETASVEALFEPGGRCLGARGMADPASARQLLRQAVVQVDRLRSRPIDDERPRDALLAGRWSLVDRFDHHGRRFIVAYRNPLGVLDPRRLSVREREVAARLAQGISQKAVASELGVRPSTVATIAMQVVAKLGLRSARELPLFWRDSAGQALALGRSDVVTLYCSEPPAHAPMLTPAEREVLSGIVRGQSNREIAVYRETSTRTVANQVASLLRKLGASSRTELAARSMETAG